MTVQLEVVPTYIPQVKITVTPPSAGEMRNLKIYRRQVNQSFPVNPQWTVASAMNSYSVKDVVEADEYEYKATYDFYKTETQTFDYSGWTLNGLTYSNGALRVASGQTSGTATPSSSIYNSQFASYKYLYNVDYNKGSMRTGNIPNYTNIYNFDTVNWYFDTYRKYFALASEWSSVRMVGCERSNRATGGYYYNFGSGATPSYDPSEHLYINLRDRSLPATFSKINRPDMSIGALFSGSTNQGVNRFVIELKGNATISDYQLYGEFYIGAYVEDAFIKVDEPQDEGIIIDEDGFGMRFGPFTPYGVLDAGTYETENVATLLPLKDQDLPYIYKDDIIKTPTIDFSVLVNTRQRFNRVRELTRQGYYYVYIPTSWKRKLETGFYSAQSINFDKLETGTYKVLFEFTGTKKVQGKLGAPPEWDYSVLVPIGATYKRTLDYWSDYQEVINLI